MLEFLLGHSVWAFRSGELAFARGWPTWLFWALLAAGIAAIAFTLARRRELSWPRALVLGVLQAAFLALALLLLWRPVLNVEELKERENAVAVLVDDSGSMNSSEKPGAPTRRQQAVAALGNGVLEAINERSDLRLFSFSDRALPVDSLAALGGGAPSTRIGDALDTVTQMAASLPVAAVVLVTDGADTADTLNEAALARLAATGIPVHTVGVGPEKPDNDLEIVQLAVPPMAMANATVRATVSIRHQGQRSGTLRVHDGGRLIAAQDVRFNGNAGVTTVSVEFPAGAAGVRDLTVSVDPAQGETRLANNQRQAVMEVDGRRRAVLYIEGEPRWEYKFIRRAVEGDAGLRLASAVRATPNRYYRQGLTSPDELEKGFPATREELFSYDAVIIGSLEAAELSNEQHEWLRDFVDLRGGSLLMLAGRDGLGDGGWSRVPIAGLLPSKLPGGAERGFGRLASRVRLTDYGRESIIGRLESDPAANEKAWEELPALADIQDIGALRPAAVVLLEAVSGTGNRTRVMPLLASQRYGRGSTWIMATSTSWRWQMQMPLEDQKHETFWRQLLYTLAAGSPARVSLQPERAVYEDDTAVTLEAEVLGKDYAPLNDATITVQATSEHGLAVPVRIESTGRGDGRHTVALDARAPGMYRVELVATRGEEEVGRAVAHLRRADGVLEEFSSWQHRPMLERIARTTGARYWTLDDLSGLPEAIRYSRAGVVERQTLDLWNMPLAFFLLALLKAGEWLLRRHWRRL
jgi:uncharacterized membrane protein|nr:MAG: hypothetical protein DIU62_02565 [Pseudomonadota bacterium]